MSKIALVLCVAMVAATGCSLFSDDPSQAPMTLEPLTERGQIEIERDGDVIAVEDETSVEAGDVVSTGGGAEGRLRLTGRRQVTVGGDAASSLEVVGGTSVRADEGMLLADVGDPMEVLVDDGTVEASDALFRVDRGFGSSRVATYSGSIGVTGPGQPQLKVPALFEASVTISDALPPRPYRIDPDDRWDARLLSEVIELDGSLDRLSVALANQLGRSRPTVAYFSSVTAREGSASFVRPYLSESTVDLLIAFAIAREARGGSDRAALERSFDLFRRGGTWAVVAAIMRVSPRALLARLRGAIADTGVIAAGGGAAPEFTTGGGGPAGDGAAAGPGDSGDTGDGGELDAPSGNGGGGSTPAGDGGSDTEPAPDDGGGGGGGGDGGGGDGGGGDGGGGDGGGGGGDDDECDGLVDCTIESLPSPTLPALPGGG